MTMLFLDIVASGKENMRAFIRFSQDELRAFIKQNNASCYDLFALGKAEANIELLKKNARMILPFSNCTREYCGYFNVQNWEDLYSALFSHAETNASIHYKSQYYRSAHLKSMLKETVRPFTVIDTQKKMDEFSISYRSDLMDNSERMCIIKIGIHSKNLEAFHFFHHFVRKLDDSFPNEFLSACIDYSDDLSQGFKVDSEMLTKRIINIGKAFYVSNKLQTLDISTNEILLRHYKFTRMSNGAWFTQNDVCMQKSCYLAQLYDVFYDLLTPQYMVISWTSLPSVKCLRPTDFDTVTVYYDKYSPTDPILILSRGYSPKQLDKLSKKHGSFLVLQEQYPTELLLDDL